MDVASDVYLLRAPVNRALYDSMFWLRSSGLTGGSRRCSRIAPTWCPDRQPRVLVVLGPTASHAFSSVGPQPILARSPWSAAGDEERLCTKVAPGPQSWGLSPLLWVIHGRTDDRVDRRLCMFSDRWCRCRFQLPVDRALDVPPVQAVAEQVITVRRSSPWSARPSGRSSDGLADGVINVVGRSAGCNRRLLLRCGWLLPRSRRGPGVALAGVRADRRLVDLLDGPQLVEQEVLRLSFHPMADLHRQRIGMSACSTSRVVGPP